MSTLRVPAGPLGQPAFRPDVRGGQFRAQIGDTPAAALSAAAISTAELATKLGEHVIAGKRQSDMAEIEAQTITGIESARQEAMSQKDPVAMQDVFDARMGLLRKQLMGNVKDKVVLREGGNRFTVSSARARVGIGRAAFAKQRENSRGSLNTLIEGQAKGIADQVSNSSMGTTSEIKLGIGQMERSIRESQGFATGLDSDAEVNTLVKKATRAALIEGIDKATSENPARALFLLNEGVYGEGLERQDIEALKANAEEQVRTGLAKEVNIRTVSEPAELLFDLKHGGLGALVPAAQARHIQSVEAQMSRTKTKELTAEGRVQSEIFDAAVGELNEFTDPSKRMTLGGLQRFNTSVKESAMSEQQKGRLISNARSAYHGQNYLDQQRKQEAAIEGLADMPTALSYQNMVQDGLISSAQSAQLQATRKSRIKEATKNQNAIIDIDQAFEAGVPIPATSQKSYDTWYQGRISKQISDLEAKRKLSGDTSKVTSDDVMDMVLSDSARSGLLPSSVTNQARAGLNSQDPKAVKEAVDLLERLRTGPGASGDAFKAATNTREEQLVKEMHDLRALPTTEYLKQRDFVMDSLNGKGVIVGANPIMTTDEFNVVADKSLDSIAADLGVDPDDVPRDIRQRFRVTSEIESNRTGSIDRGVSLANIEATRSLGTVGFGANKGKMTFFSMMKSYGKQGFTDEEQMFDQFVGELGPFLDGTRAGDSHTSLFIDGFSAKETSKIMGLEGGAIDLRGDTGTLKGLRKGYTNDHLEIVVDPGSRLGKDPIYFVNFIDDDGNRFALMRRDSKGSIDKLTFVPDFNTSPAGEAAKRDRLESKREDASRRLTQLRRNALKNRNISNLPSFEIPEAFLPTPGQ